MFLCCCPSKVNQEQPENGDPDLEENKQGKLKLVYSKHFLSHNSKDLSDYKKKNIHFT